MTDHLTRLCKLVERLPEAIKATEYKYFGDYEMSDDQREAVDTLVESAQALPQLLARITALEAALEPFAYGDIDVSHTAVITGSDCSLHMRRAQSALQAGSEVGGE